MLKIGDDVKTVTILGSFKKIDGVPEHLIINRIPNSSGRILFFRKSLDLVHLMHDGEKEAIYSYDEIVENI